MYRRPKFLELLIDIRREMAHEADYDVVLFVENVRHGSPSEPVVNPRVPSTTAAKDGGDNREIRRI